MKGKILLIEDNEKNRYLVSFLLKSHGYEVVEAVDGRSGIEIAIKTLPDLILLDIQLPGMDGYAVARELRQQDKLNNVPIVAVTSYAMTGDRARVLAAGCTGYIEKPIHPDTFISQVEQHMVLNDKSIDSR